MQDALPWLAPLAVSFWLALNLRRISLPTRIDIGLVAIVAGAVYLVLNTWLHRSFEGISIGQFVRSHGRAFYMYGLVGLFYLVSPRTRIEHSLYRAAILAGGLAAAISLFAHFVMPIRVGPLESGVREHLDGLFGGHNPAAGSFGLVLLLAASARLGIKHRSPSLVVSWWEWCCIAVVLVAFLTAQSRGYTLALVVAMVVLLGPAHLKTVMCGRTSVSLITSAAAVLVVAGLAGLTLSDRLSNLTNDPAVLVRFALYQRAWSMSQESPIVGLGLGSFQQSNLTTDEVLPFLRLRTGGTYREEIIGGVADGGQHTHNLFLQLLVESGAIGLLLVLGLVLAGLSAASELHRRIGPGADAINPRLVVGLSVYLLTAGLTAGYSLVSPGTAWLYYVALGRTMRRSSWRPGRQVAAGATTWPPGVASQVG